MATTKIDVRTSSRKMEDLQPLVNAMAQAAFYEIKKEGINPLLVETYRSLQRQYYLYCKDRTYEQAVANGVPTKYAKLYTEQLKTEKYTGGKVTWTLNSIHIKRQALDVVPQRKVNGETTAIWDSNDEQTKKIVAIMSKYGFEAGANWEKNVDSPHFQVKDKLPSVLRRGYATPELTKSIQNALNHAVNAGLDVNGKWDKNVDAAISKFRKQMRYKTTTPTLGAEALRALLSFLL